MSRLFVGNFPHASTEDDLSAWFVSHGFAVESAQVIRDRETGISRGFGFVTLKETYRNTEVIQELNGKRMGGRVLTVGEARPIDRNSRGGEPSRARGF